MKDFFKGFYYAGRGIALAVRSERNLRFHLSAAFYVLLFSFFYDFSTLEYLVLLLIVAGVLSLEMVNSALERAVDHAGTKPSPTAAAAKDMAAGGVLVFCVAAAVCGILMFWDTAVFSQIFLFFAAHPLLIAALLLSLAFWFWFVFIFGKKR